MGGHTGCDDARVDGPGGTRQSGGCVALPARNGRQGRRHRCSAFRAGGSGTAQGTSRTARGIFAGWTTQRRRQPNSHTNAELHRCRERPTRIELASSAWKAEVLPLNYGRESGSILRPLLSTSWTRCLFGWAAGVLRRPGRPLLRGGGRGPSAPALYPDDLTESSRHLALFLTQYWGGPGDLRRGAGHPRLRMRHAPFVIGPAERDAWLRHMLGRCATCESAWDHAAER